MSKARAAVAVVAVVATAGGVVALSRPAPPRAAPPDEVRTVAVEASMLTCPGLPTSGQSQTAVLAVAPGLRSAGLGQPADTDTTTLSLAPLGRPRAAPARPARPGVPLTRTFPAGEAAATVVRGTGGTAPGLAATQWTTGGSSVSTALPGASGLAVSRCDAAADRWWFQGVSTTVGTASRLVLTNPSPSTAVVDLAFYGAAGVVEGVGAGDIAVAAESRSVLDLARYAPGLVDGTVAVVTTTGRVVAAVHVDEQEGLAPLGSEWVAPSAAPTTQVLVNATHDDADSRRLLITNPGDREALVQVRLLDSDGPFVSTELDVVRVRPGEVVVEDLSDAVGNTPAAILLTSTSPITSGIVDEFEPTGSRPADLSSAGASPQLGEPAVVPTIPGSKLDLVLSSTTRAGGAVVVDVRDADGRSTSTDRLNVRGLSNLTWRAPDRGSYVVVSSEPGVGIHASALYSGEDGVAALPVLSGVFTATRPAVSPAP